MNAVYMLNYVINRELGRKGGKIFAFFADLKAFENVDRRQLNEGDGDRREPETENYEDVLRNEKCG